MRKLKKITTILLTFALILTLLPVQNTEAAARVKLNKTKATIYEGNTTTLKLTGTKKKIIWTSGNKKVATVNNKGKVTGKKPGKTTITAKVSGKKYKCTVTVKKTFINATQKTLDVGKTCTLKLTGTAIKSVSSGNKKVATISKKGVVTAQGAGVAVITVKGKNGKTYKCTITVKQPEMAHTHKYTSSITEPATCQKKGVVTYSCSCGAGYTEDIPP